MLFHLWNTRILKMDLDYKTLASTAGLTQHENYSSQGNITTWKTEWWLNNYKMFTKMYFKIDYYLINFTLVQVQVLI